MRSFHTTFRVYVYFNEILVILNKVWWLVAEVSAVKSSSAECRWALLMISQYWFR